MLEIVRLEAKNKDLALRNALEKLNAEVSEVYYYFEEVEGGLFSSKKVRVIAITKYSVKEYLKKFLKDLEYYMNTNFEFEVMENENGYSIVIISDNVAALIGKEGNTLNSIQNILRQSVAKIGNFDIRINLDISNYKAKKEKNLAFEVRKISKEVLSSGIPAKLDPMNSYERLVVHKTVAKYAGLTTESVGETPNRCVVIKCKED